MIKNQDVLLEECKKAGYSIVSIGMPCEDLPLSMGIQEVDVKRSIFCGPEDARVTTNGVSIPAIWEIGRTIYKSTNGFGHSIAPFVMLHAIIRDVAMLCGVYRLVEGEWQISQ